MGSALLLWLACAASTVGFGWIALSMDKHWNQVHLRRLPAGRRWPLRCAGVLALAVGLALCLAADPVSMAVLAWMQLLAVGSVLVALALQWRPRVLRWLWPARKGS